MIFWFLVWGGLLHIVRFTAVADDIIMKTEAEKVNGDEEENRRVRKNKLKYLTNKLFNAIANRFSISE